METKNEEEYIEWFLKFSKEFKRILTDDGSFVVDLGGAYLPGHPVRSIYQYELLCRMVREQGFFLAQEFFHYNPARLPAPAEWVNVRRIRVKDSVNLVWWLSKSEYPKADNKNVLRPYTEAMKSLLKKGYVAKKRPSGHDITAKFNVDHGGAIPPNVLELGNNDSNSVYMLKSKSKRIKATSGSFPQNALRNFHQVSYKQRRHRPRTICRLKYNRICSRTITTQMDCLRIERDVYEKQYASF